jgi:hypothetical protein
MSILALILAAQAAPQIQSEPIDAGHFRLSISGRIDSVEAGQAALMPTARQLCGARPVSFGTFRLVQSKAGDSSSSAKSPADLKLEQELSCAPKRNIDAAATRAPGWEPSEADQQAVLAATYAYFAARDRGRYPQAWSMLTDSMKQLSPIGEWQRGVAAFNAAAGAVRARRVVEITWYNNPPDAARRGVYAAADYSGEFDRLDFVCGYVMWQLQPDGSLRLSREEQNLLDKATAAKLASIDRQPLRVQMGCKD